MSKSIEIVIKKNKQTNNEFKKFNAELAVVIFKPQQPWICERIVKMTMPNFACYFKRLNLTFSRGEHPH